ncbi:integrase [Rhodobacter capsulatus B6]|nr:integrase [Rhodobacter capsulatus B6]
MTVFRPSRWSCASSVQRHRGTEVAVQGNRHLIYEAARVANPERWSGKTRQWTPIGSVRQNPD